MKFKLGTVYKICLDCYGNIQTIEEKVQVVSVKNCGHTIQITSHSTDYFLIELDGKFLYTAKENASKDTANRSITTPGSVLSLWPSNWYAISSQPEDNEWTIQDILELMNTFTLRKRLEEARKANENLKEFISKKGVSILDRYSATQMLTKQEKPLEKLIENLTGLLDQTALSF